MMPGTEFTEAQWLLPMPAPGGARTCTHTQIVDCGSLAGDVGAAGADGHPGGNGNATHVDTSALTTCNMVYPPAGDVGAVGAAAHAGATKFLPNSPAAHEDCLTSAAGHVGAAGGATRAGGS